MTRSKLGVLTSAITLGLAVTAGCGGSAEDPSGSPSAGQTTGSTQTGATPPKPGGSAGTPATTPGATGSAGRNAMTMTPGGVSGMSGMTMTMAKPPASTGAGGTPATSGGNAPAAAGSAAPATAGKSGGAAGSTAAAAGTGGSSTAAAGGAGAAGSSATGEMGSGNNFIRGADPADSLSGAMPGPYKVEAYTDGYRNGPSYADSTINYPTDAEPPFALVVIVPGFVSPQSSIASWGPFLASHGIVTMSIGTNFSTDAPGARAEALKDAMVSLKEEHDRADSPLKGKLDVTKTATMGWSMGGGGTLLVANEDPNLKATISLCGWNPGYPYTMIKSPALMFASLGDPLAGGQSQGFYRSIPDSTPKMLIEMGAGDHFLANNPNSTQGTVGRYGLAWLKVFLEGDERYRKFIQQEPMVSTTDFQSNIK
jgi:dienelactone hydrolase